jgi:hypothetical protein
VRVARTILSLAALFWGFVQAPFLHVHAEEAVHPATTFAHLHAHASEQHWSGPTIGAHTPDEDAIDIEWRIAQPPTIAFTPALAITQAVVIEPPLIVSATVSIPRPRGHDPPDLTPKQPRSPPA